jgi:hypothetical protein
MKLTQDAVVELEAQYQELARVTPIASLRPLGSVSSTTIASSEKWAALDAKREEWQRDILCQDTRDPEQLMGVALSLVLRIQWHALLIATLGSGPAVVASNQETAAHFPRAPPEIESDEQWALLERVRHLDTSHRRLAAFRATLVSVAMFAMDFAGKGVAPAWLGLIEDWVAEQVVDDEAALDAWLKAELLRALDLGPGVAQQEAHFPKTKKPDETQSLFDDLLPSPVRDHIDEEVGKYLEKLEEATVKADKS